MYATDRKIERAAVRFREHVTVGEEIIVAAALPLHPRWQGRGHSVVVVSTMTIFVVPDSDTPFAVRHWDEQFEIILQDRPESHRRHAWLGSLVLSHHNAYPDRPNRHLGFVTGVLFDRPDQLLLGAALAAGARRHNRTHPGAEFTWISDLYETRRQIDPTLPPAWPELPEDWEALRRRLIDRSGGGES